MSMNAVSMCIPSIITSDCSAKTHYKNTSEIRVDVSSSTMDCLVTQDKVYKNWKYKA